MYEYQCEYCNGIVEERIVTEDFRYKGELVIFHNVPVGICNRCKTRYYNAKVLKQLEKIAKEKGPVHLVLCGKQTNDGDTGHVGPGIAAWFDWPNVAYVKKVEAVDDEKIVVHRMMEDGTDVLEMDLPAVIAVVKEINEPRVASLKGKMSAKKALIPKWSETDIEADKTKIGLTGSPTIVAKSFNPPPRKGGVRLEGATVEEKASKLVDTLRGMKLI
jgi:electron transfer flavoprotein beta subunit